uniref:THAP-type domain-containing protein n=1 Tax=Amphimedon queenslandica TaxID=400682 RepID=A0A1X7U783_AMPQE
MVNNCCVVGCHNSVGKKAGLRFFSFPLKDKAQLKRWTMAVNRAKWKPRLHTLICNEHLVEGKPHSHPDHPDYVPTIFPEVYKKGKQKKKSRRLLNRDQNCDGAGIEVVLPYHNIGAEVPSTSKAELDQVVDKMQQETDALLKEFEEKKKSRKLAEEIEMILHACNERKAKRMLSDEQEMDEELIESDEELIETIESDEEPIESDVEEPVAEQESHDNESQGACEWLVLHSQITPSDKEGVPSSTEGMPSSTEVVV